MLQNSYGVLPRTMYRSGEILSYRNAIPGSLLRQCLRQLQDGGSDILTKRVSHVGNEAGNWALSGHKGLNSEANEGNLRGWDRQHSTLKKIVSRYRQHTMASRPFLTSLRAMVLEFMPAGSNG